MRLKFTIINHLYWVVPVVLFALQVFFTLNSMSQIRSEELGNGVRVPFWLANRTIHPLATNVGWDGGMALIYSIFGFDLFAGKYFRLALQLVSLFCLAAILRKFLGKLAWLPLLTIGLSPTLLFFVSFQSQYAIDLQYLPIVLFLLLRSPLRVLPRVFHPKKPDKRGPFLGVPLPVSPASGSRHPSLVLLSYFSAWALAMIAWMSYPTFVFYLPALAFFHLRGVPSTSLRAGAAHPGGVLSLVATLLGFLSPLLFAFVYVKNREMLIWDPATETGIFRGGGGKFLEAGTIDPAIVNLFSDLFKSGVSYNFDIRWGEFSLAFPAITLVTVLVLSFIFWRREKHLRPLFGIFWAIIFFNLAIYLFVSDPTGIPGLRRATPALAAFYALFTLSWYLVTREKVGRWAKVLVAGTLLLLPLHHLIVYPINLEAIKKESVYSEKYWLGENPYQTFQEYLTRLQKEDVYLKCEKIDGVDCRYGDAYAALAAACLWNDLKCHTIYGFDPTTLKFIPLSRELWDSGYLAR